jgi:hypothetical protein
LSYSDLRAYGVVSFGTKNLDWVKQYILNQRSHRGAGKTVDRLERVTDPESHAHDGPVDCAGRQEEPRERG